MSQENRVSVSLSNEQRNLIERARGSIDIAVFIREGALIYARNMAAFRSRLLTSAETMIDGIDDLSPEDHLRLADAAEEDAMELEEFDRAMDTLMSELEAHKHSEATQ